MAITHTSVVDVERGAALDEARTIGIPFAGHVPVTMIAPDTSFLHPPGFSLHDELALLVRSGLTPAEALRAATINAARLFPASNTGRIVAGAIADLVLLEGNPLVDIGRTKKIAAVVAAGRYFDRAALDGMLRDAVSRAAVN